MQTIWVTFCHCFRRSWKIPLKVNNQRTLITVTVKNNFRLCRLKVSRNLRIWILFKTKTICLIKILMTKCSRLNRCSINSFQNQTQGLVMVHPRSFLTLSANKRTSMSILLLFQDKAELWLKTKKNWELRCKKTRLLRSFIIKNKKIKKKLLTNIKKLNLNFWRLWENFQDFEVNFWKTTHWDQNY